MYKQIVHHDPSIQKDNCNVESQKQKFVKSTSDNKNNRKSETKAWRHLVEFAKQQQRTIIITMAQILFVIVVEHFLCDQSKGWKDICFSSRDVLN